MQGRFGTLDWCVLGGYFLATMAIGVVFHRRSRSAEGFTAAGRSLPGWVCGLSIFATYLSSISFLALPGKAYASNWNAFAFSLSLPIATWLAVRFFLPYYRRSGEVSAYAMLERRFGPWARGYVSLFYLLTQLARMGVVMYLIALPLHVLLGWNLWAVILATGLSVTVYALIGGIAAVIWADAVQAIVLMGGAGLCAVLMLVLTPGGPSGVFAVAREHHKFSLGATTWSWTQPTVWVVLLYGMVINLQNFGIDQSYIQRYIASSSDREARKSLWLGGLLYVPISALFFFIGTELFAFYQGRPEALAQVRQIAARRAVLQAGMSASEPGFEAACKRQERTLKPSQVGDMVFPHFIGQMLPRGIRGLLIAAIFAAGMSTVSTSLNSSATLAVDDWYRRYVRPGAGPAETLGALYVATGIWGVAGTAVALWMTGAGGSALDVWWTWSGILGGGMLGLFLLGRISRAGNAAAALGVSLGLGLIAWATLSLKTSWFPKAWRWHIHEYLIPAVGVTTILLAGLGLGILIDHGHTRFRGLPRT